MSDHPITTTLNRIRAHGPCKDGWEKLLKHLGKTKADDEPLPFSVILKSNGIDDALWCCRAEPQYAREWRLFAVWCARQVQRLMTDQRSIDALDVAERHANGQATDAELAMAQAAALDAELYTAEAAAWDAAWAAAWNAARDAVWASAEASTEITAWDATWEAARKAQAAKFIEIVGDADE